MKPSRKNIIKRINEKLLKVKKMSDLEFSLIFNTNTELWNLCFLDITEIMLKKREYYFSYKEIKNINKRIK